MTKLVGILNVTPDSFSDGGKYLVPDVAIAHAESLFAAGASIVDVGAESTRPHATPLSDDEEWQRLEPVLSALLPRYAGKISVDSYHPTTIERALRLGDIIVNDITGLRNPSMVELVIQAQPTVIISHHPDMDIQESHTTQPIHDVEQVRHELLAQANQLESGGLSHDKIILDPGIGFGKTMELNAELLKFARLVPDYAVMIGYSRKRFLGENRMDLAPNIDAGRIAIEHGAAYLRVHDVAGHTQAFSAKAEA